MDNLPNDVFDSMSDANITTAYKKLDVKQTLNDINNRAQSIITSLQALTISKQIIDDFTHVQLLVNIEELTLAGLYRNVIFTNHIVNTLMQSIDDDEFGGDIGQYMSLMSLQRDSIFMVHTFMSYLRSLPHIFKSLNAEYMELIPPSDGDDEDTEYATPRRSNERLIEEIDQITQDISNRDKAILERTAPDMPDNFKE
jgi:hypothetical protein